MTFHRGTAGLSSNEQQQETEDDRLLPEDSILSRWDPPAYSPLDAYRYSDGVQLDLPADVIGAAIEGGTFPTSAIGQGDSQRSSDRRRSRRR